MHVYIVKYVKIDIIHKILPWGDYGNFSASKSVFAVTECLIFHNCSFKSVSENLNIYKYYSCSCHTFNE